MKEPLDDDNPLHPDRIERQVLQWICDGFLPHEIARDLRISTRRWRSACAPLSTNCTWTGAPRRCRFWLL